MTVGIHIGLVLANGVDVVKSRNVVVIIRVMTALYYDLNKEAFRGNPRVLGRSLAELPIVGGKIRERCFLWRDHHGEGLYNVDGRRRIKKDLLLAKRMR